MVEKHSSSQFEAELNAVSTRIMEMGGLVESQIAYTMDSLNTFDDRNIEMVISIKDRVNDLEVEIDSELTTIIATRQPTARDLRMLIAISKATAELENISYESRKIARMVKSIIEEGVARNLPILDLRFSGDLCTEQLRYTLDAFARMDVDKVIQIMQGKDAIDSEFEGYARKLVTYMMEDPRTISASMDLLLIAKTLERIVVHCKHLAELIVFMVKGVDVRHSSLEDIVDLVNKSNHSEKK